MGPRPPSLDKWGPQHLPGEISRWQVRNLGNLGNALGICLNNGKALKNTWQTRLMTIMIIAYNVFFSCIFWNCQQNWRCCMRGPRKDCKHAIQNECGWLEQYMEEWWRMLSNTCCAICRIDKTFIHLIEAKQPMTMVPPCSGLTAVQLQLLLLQDSSVLCNCYHWYSLIIIGYYD